MRAVRFFSTLFALLLLATAVSAQGRPQNFRAHLTGAEEVPPVSTHAQGQAVFRALPNGSGIQFHLITANVRDVLMAHIHLAPAGQNGPVVVWLYPSAPPPVQIPGRSDGVLASGVITAANLVGPLAGQTLQDLIDAIAAGNAYVNVHTTEFPSGEVRGQIR